MACEPEPERHCGYDYGNERVWRTGRFGRSVDGGRRLDFDGGPGRARSFRVGLGFAGQSHGTESFATHGDGAVGLFVTNGGGLTATGPITINTAGGDPVDLARPRRRFGVEADGEGSQINLAATTIATTGEASDGLGTGHGGVITVSGPLGVVTGGSSAYGAWAQSTGSAITLNGPSTFTINSGAFALLASEGGVISTADTMGVVVDGVAAGGVEANAASCRSTSPLVVVVAFDRTIEVALEFGDRSIQFSFFRKDSVTSLAQARLNQLITSRVLGSLLLGANEQVSGCDYGGGFASIGSFSLGSHGR